MRRLAVRKVVPDLREWRHLLGNRGRGDKLPRVRLQGVVLVAVRKLLNLRGVGGK